MLVTAAGVLFTLGAWALGASKEQVRFVVTGVVVTNTKLDEVRIKSDGVGVKLDKINEKLTSMDGKLEASSMC